MARILPMDTISKEEFDRLYKGKTPPAAAQKNNIPKVGVGIAGGSFARSNASTASSCIWNASSYACKRASSWPSLRIFCA